jgi:hypothetical protein
MIGRAKIHVSTSYENLLYLIVKNMGQDGSR